MERKPCARDFYPGDCARQVDHFLNGFQPPVEPARPLAGVVPHAGWAYSGAVAAKVLYSLRAAEPETFVLFGTTHRWGVPEGATYPAGAWATPLGPVEVDAELAELLLAQCPGHLTGAPDAHRGEHSIEVLLPMIKHLYPQARIVPVAMPPSQSAADAGAAVGAALARADRKAAVVGSTDLTHYGRHFPFTPWGLGAEAYGKMRENDQRIIRLALAFKAAEVVDEAVSHSNACGPGALAATIAAAKSLGATSAALLEYTTSHDVMHGRPDEFEMAVGYAGILFGK